MEVYEASFLYQDLHILSYLDYEALDFFCLVGSSGGGDQD